MWQSAFTFLAFFIACAYLCLIVARPFLTSKRSKHCSGCPSCALKNISQT
ncbi:MAG: hypothetical protein ACFCUI_04460 [Bernardetiaceae bacterium]